MGPDAIKILHELKLQTIPSYDNMDFIPTDDKKYYLRYDNKNKHQNRVVNGKFLKENFHQCRIEIESKSLLQISEYIDTRAGAVLYVRDNFVYGEVVLGEPVLILRRGFCKRRFFVAKDRVRFIDYDQTFCYFQDKGFTKNCYSDFEFNQIFVKIIDYCHSLMNEKKTGYVFEIHITASGIIFTDAKLENTFNISYESFMTLFKTRKGEYYVMKGKVSEDAICDKLDIDTDKLWKSVCVHEGALLSHYITYYYESIENLIFER